VKLFQYRVPEELYDFERDPDALVNLIDDERYAGVVTEMRIGMARIMSETNDPLRAQFMRSVLQETQP
jgi:N-sulfoglucosamine sulfohydrolase